MEFFRKIARTVRTGVQGSNFKDFLDSELEIGSSELELGISEFQNMAALDEIRSNLLKEDKRRKKEKVRVRKSTWRT